MSDFWIGVTAPAPQARMQKKPAGVTPSASPCDCRLDFRCHRDLRQGYIGMVNERLIGQFIPACSLWCTGQFDDTRKANGAQQSGYPNYQSATEPEFRKIRKRGKGAVRHRY
jgi:hypothetical protein